jgi:hypothetical protein
LEYKSEAGRYLSPGVRGQSWTHRETPVSKTTKNAKRFLKSRKELMESPRGQEASNE